MLQRKLFSNSLKLSSFRCFSKSKNEWSGTKDNRETMEGQFFQSLKSSLKGLANLNYIIEHDPNLSEEEKVLKKRFLIYRYDPSDEDDTPKLVSYYVDISKIPPMYLDVLMYIKENLDSTLSFRRSCREGICGSCSMNCDGLHSLACIKPVNRDLSTPAVITPLGHMFVLRDLIVDMTHFYIQYKAITPYLRRKTPKKENEGVEHFQSQEDRKKLDGLYECILCACCSSSCPSYWWRPDRYLGPAVLLQAYRWILDSRDEFRNERLAFLTRGDNLTDCVNIGMCTVTCPKGLDPRSAIENLFAMVRTLKQENLEKEQTPY